MESNLEIFMEFRKKINHALIGLDDSNLESITKVISHPQALQQCSNFLEKLDIELQPVFDTAGSVMSLLENDSKTIAAIAGEHFGNDKRFKILENNISNHVENYTRFFLVGKEDPDISVNKDKRSAILIADDKPGSLLKGLKIFEELKLNLTKLESRPILGSPWEYKFYIDYQNENNEVDNQLEEKLSKVTKEFRIIGKFSCQLWMFVLPLNKGVRSSTYEAYAMSNIIGFYIIILRFFNTVSYTHLTLPTNREV